MKRVRLLYDNRNCIEVYLKWRCWSFGAVFVFWPNIGGTFFEDNGQYASDVLLRESAEYERVQYGISDGLLRDGGRHAEGCMRSRRSFHY